MTDRIGPSAVVKVGGSLLDWPELPRRLSDFLEAQFDESERIVLFAGGGRSVDVIRNLDLVHRFGDIGAHHLAIQALDLTARILERLMPGVLVVVDEVEMRMCWDAGIIPILAPSRMVLKPRTGPEGQLPASWDVTSDSIAAWIAARLDADRLILIKSAEVAEGVTRNGAVLEGLVDPYFPEAARHLKRVTYRNLRDRTGGLIALPEEE